MPPLIGITSDVSSNRFGQRLTQLPEAYSYALAQAGAVPVLIPSLPDSGNWSSLAGRLDAIVFSGGGDIDPAQYAGKRDARLKEVSPVRDQVELALLRTAIESGKPFLGICRGCQLVNVAFGGTLHADLNTCRPSSIRHDHPGDERKVLVHEVSLESGTQLAGIVSRHAIAVNSHHHQGLKEIGPGLRVSARAPDGLIEAVELPGHPFGVAVQWHPEWLTHQEWTRQLFRGLVDAAANRLTPAG